MTQEFGILWITEDLVDVCRELSLKTETNKNVVGKHLHSTKPAVSERYLRHNLTVDCLMPGTRF